MSVWRLQIYDDKVGKYCLDNNVIAMGWGFEELFENPEHKLDSSFKDNVNSLYDNWGNFLEYSDTMGYEIDCLETFYENMTPGDLIWTCIDDRYYIAKISDETKWQFKQEARELGAANQFTNIQWHYAGNNNDLVPPSIKTAFSDEENILRKILDYDVETFSAWLVKAFEAEGFIEPLNIWRILTYTDGGNISQYCIDNNVAAIGWSLSDDEAAQINTWEDYEDCCQALNSYVNSNLKRFHNEVENGDVIWMHAEDGYYYFAVVSEKSKWCFNKTPEAREKDASNQLTNIDWHRVEDWESIPKELPNNFWGQTFKRIYNPVVREFTLRMLRETK